MYEGPNLWGYGTTAVVNGVCARGREAFEVAVLVHLYPNSQIDIFLQIVQVDGGRTAAAINAVTPLSSLASILAPIYSFGLLGLYSAVAIGRHMLKYSQQNIHRPIHVRAHCVLRSAHYAGQPRSD